MSELAAVDEIRELYAYNRWANHRALGAAGALSAEDFSRDLRNSFPSVRDTLTHMLGAEWVWMSRWSGVSPTSFPDAIQLTTVDQIAARWKLIENDQDALLARLTPITLTSNIDYRTFAGQPYSAPLWQLMRHVVNHATYHRGQITTMLRQLGARPVSTDLVQFYRERTAPPIDAS